MGDDEFNMFEQDDDDIDPIDMIGSDEDPLFDDVSDTASLSNDESPRVDVINPLETLQSGTDAYYFDTVKGDSTRKHNNTRTVDHDGPNPFVVAVVVFSLLAGASFVVWRLFTPQLGNTYDSKAFSSNTKSDGLGDSGRRETIDALQGKDIMSLVAEDFMYNGQDISLDSNRLGVQIRNGHVLVTHTLEEGAKMIPESLVRNAGLRSNLLASKLTNKIVGGGSGSLFQRLTWVVRDQNGKAYLATIENPGNVRYSDETFGVLATSQGYVIAPGILLSLGEDPGIAVRSGEQPTDLDGFAIAADSRYKAPVVNKDNNTQITQQPVQTNTSSEKAREDKNPEKKEEKKSEEKNESESDSKKDSAGKSEPNDKSNGNPSNNAGGNSSGNSGGDSGGTSGGDSSGDNGGDNGDSGGGTVEPTPDPEPVNPEPEPTPDPDPPEGGGGGE